MVAGCVSEPESHVVAAPPPAGPVAANTTTTTTVTTAPATARVPVATTATPVAPNTVVVTQAPPVVPAEVVPPQPSSAHKWVAGYWAWRDDHYLWIAGHWEVPPRPDATWMPPRWEHRDATNDYVFYDGYWN